MPTPKRHCGIGSSNSHRLPAIRSNIGVSNNVSIPGSIRGSNKSVGVVNNSPQFAQVHYAPQVHYPPIDYLEEEIATEIASDGQKLLMDEFASQDFQSEEEVTVNRYI